jgi:hypothetical protein
LGTQGNARPDAAGGPTNAYVIKYYKTNNEKYCWSHGYQVGLNHASANCTKKALGHKDNSTKAKIMGGDTWDSEFLWQDGAVQINYLSSQNFMNYLNFTPSIPSKYTALLDSGCTVHFLLANVKFLNKTPAATPLSVRLPNGDTIASTHTVTLNMPSLPHAARQAHILPGLAQESLLSVGQMCDSGFSVTFTATDVTVTNGESTILTGLRDKDSGMWRTPLKPNLPLEVGRENSAHNVYEQKSIQDTITYLYACCFSPATDNWLRAIQNGHFATWPSVTVENMRKYLSKSDATSKGHMNQIRQNIRSTQPAVEQPALDPDMVQEEKCNYIYAAVMETNQIYTDLTGRFPTTSLSGNKYILILYDDDSNNVLSSPMKNRSDKDMVRAFDLLMQSLIICGLNSHLQLSPQAYIQWRKHRPFEGR